MAYAHEPVALAWALEGIGLAAGRALKPIQRVCFYLPLEHAEDLEMQYRAVAQFEALEARFLAEHGPGF